MDHLNIPESCLPQVQEIPYLGVAPKYDHGGLDGMPERFTLNSETIVSSHSILTMRAEWIESFIQEWLWFGLAHEFTKACDIHFNADDFVKPSVTGNGLVISTAQFSDAYPRRAALRQLEVFALDMGKPSDTWIKAACNLGGNLQSNDVTNAPGSHFNNETIPLDVLYSMMSIVRQVLYDQGRVNPPNDLREPTRARRRLSDCIQRAQNATRKISAQKNPVVRFDIILSIEILCCTMTKIIDMVFDEYIPTRPHNFSHHFEKRMLSQNWCPAKISSAIIYDAPLAYVASLLPSYEATPHYGCTQRKCNKYPSLADIVPQHHEDCHGSCKQIATDESQLISIWKSGGIPGVKLATVDAKESWTVVDCKNHEFIAISHVWAHGLGNSAKNQLPLCQVQFLHKLIEAAGGATPTLWIDTLSVPVDSQGKRIAIPKLRTVYKEASQVLVIDKDLLKVGQDKEERVLRLLTSDWTRRLWTLQEGRLANELKIQFKNSAARIPELTPSVGSLDYHFNFLSTLRRQMERQFSHQETSHDKFLSLVEDCATRSVTVNTDEAVCLATLLGLSLEDFDSSPTMADIYRSLTSVPQDLVFLEQPRLKEPGLTWAPCTFLEQGPIVFLDDESPSQARITVDGLPLTKDCVKLNGDFSFQRDVSKPLPEYYFLKASDGRKYAIQSRNFFSPDGYISRAEPSRLIHNPILIWQKTGNKFRSTSAAILVSQIEEKGVSLVVGLR